MKRILSFMLCAAGILWLTSCASNQMNSEDDSQESAVISEQTDENTTQEMQVHNADEAEMEAESETESGTETKTVAEAIEILQFVDVYGQQYETEILTSVEKHLYDWTNLLWSGNQVSYEDETYTSRLGIDVSYYQGEIDWQKVKDAGVTFAFIRIGYRGYGESGVLCEDTRALENITGAQRAGLDVGVYFFSQAVNEEEALEEAEFVLEKLQGIELELPVVYDPESILDDDARTDNVSGEQFTKNTIVFAERIREAGYEAMIYSNMLWEAFEFQLEDLSDLEIWYADYEEIPQTPYHFTFWQYTNSGSIDGIDGVVDLDIQIYEK